MRKTLAIAWLALTGLAALFLLGAWLISPQIRHAFNFGDVAKSVAADVAIMAPAIRYLRKGDNDA